MKPIKEPPNLAEDYIRFRAERSVARRCVDLYGFKGQNQIPTIVEWDEVDHAIRQNPSPISIDETAAQILMDDLWDAGVRPTEGAGTAGAMRATQEHIQDLRGIISYFKSLPPR